jgi:hypothetical protein
LQRERGRLDEELGKIRQEMAEQPIACDKRISTLEATTAEM